MATILGLHRETTYDLPPDAATPEIIESEVARRTFWVLQGQESLHSDPTIPVAFPLRDISALMPTGETEFAFGRVPTGRAALPGLNLTYMLDTDNQVLTM